jgi:hypothetical protein
MEGFKIDLLRLKSEGILPWDINALFLAENAAMTNSAIFNRQLDMPIKKSLFLRN